MLLAVGTFMVETAIVHNFETFCTQAYNCRLSKLDHALQSRPSSPHFYGGTDSTVRGSRASLVL